MNLNYQMTSTLSLKTHSIKFVKRTTYHTLLNQQPTKYFAHIIRKPDNAIIEKLIFENSSRKKKGRPRSSLKAGFPNL